MRSLIVSVGEWRRATNREGTDLGRDVAPVLRGVETIGHLWRFGEREFQAVLGSQGPGGCRFAANPDAPPVTSDGIYRPDEHARLYRFESEATALLAFASKE